MEIIIFNYFKSQWGKVMSNLGDKIVKSHTTENEVRKNSTFGRFLPKTTRMIFLREMAGLP